MARAASRSSGEEAPAFVPRGSGRPVYLSINRSGHGIGSSLAILIDQRADYLAFLFDQLGMS